MRRIISQQVCRFFPRASASSVGGDFKHLVCLLEYGTDHHSGSMHAQSSRLSEFKRKHNLTNTDFRHLTDVLGLDVHTLRHLFAGRTGEFEEIMEHKLRPFRTSANQSIEGIISITQNESSL
jgi:hypothetical protein